MGFLKKKIATTSAELEALIVQTEQALRSHAQNLIDTVENIEIPKHNETIQALTNTITSVQNEMSEAKRRVEAAARHLAGS